MAKIEHRTPPRIEAEPGPTVKLPEGHTLRVAQSR
jgi:hypothetical protein